MKGVKIIAEVLLLLVVLTGAAFLIEKKYEKAGTTADQIFDNYALYKNDSITVILGSSHALMLDDYYPDTSEYVVNFSIGGQDLFRENMVLRKILKDGAKVKRVVLALDYDALGYNQVLSGEGYIDKQYYRYLDTLYDNSLANQLMGSSSFFRCNRDISYLFSDVEEGAKPVKAKGGQASQIPYIPVGTGALNTEDCKRRAIEHSSIKFKKNLLLENIQNLKEIIQACSSRNIELVVITTPKMKCYCEASNQENISLAKLKIDSLFSAEGKKVERFDFYADSTFSEKDFIDYDHLNQIGVKKLYQKLNAIFVKN